MSLINIDSGSADPFDRYKMPKIEVKIEGQKTFLPNLADVANALHVDVSWLVKFASYEFATQVKIDNKTKRVYLQGTNHAVTEMIEKFIDLFILCFIPHTITISNNCLV